MKVVYYILFCFVFLSCKKVNGRHEINSKWKLEYYVENGVIIDIPISGGEYFIQFNKKRFGCIIPISQLSGDCIIYKDGEMDIITIDVSLLGGDSTIKYWEGVFMNQLLATSSYQITESSNLNLNYSEGKMVLSKQ